MGGYLMEHGKVGVLMQPAELVIIGGAALTGGHISVMATTLAVVLIVLIQNGVVLARVDPYWVEFLLGALILAAVGLNRLRARRAEGV